MYRAARHHGIAALLVAALVATCFAAPMTISNKAADGDGRYVALVDDYGAIDGWSNSYTYTDFFNPAGPTGASGVTFAAGTFVFVSNTHRELLSGAAVWQTADLGGFTFAADTSLTSTVTSPNVASDTNGDGFADTLNSAFTVTGTGVNLGVALNQSILDGNPRTTSPGTNTAVHTLSYTVTNNGATSLDLKLDRQTDADLMLVPYNANDYVTVGSWLGSKWVGQNEPGDLTQGYTLWSPDLHSYSGLLNGLVPQPAPTAYPGGGTNGIPWLQYGLPPEWIDFAGGLGLLLDGTAGPPAADSGTYLEWSRSLGPGASATVTMEYVYGGAPAPEPCTLALLAAGLGGMLLRRRRRA